MKTTIRDVARAAGVSPYTVSSVITEKRAVKAETRQKVLKTIARLGYDPAANLPHARPVKNTVLGLVMPHMASMSPFYARAVVAFKERCSACNFNTQLISQQDIMRLLAEQPARAKSTVNCAGLLIYCPQNLDNSSWKSWVRTLAQWDIPLVLIRRPAPTNGVISITNDDEAGLRMALERLAADGHRRIGLIIPSKSHPFAAGHSETYRSFYDDAGLPYDPALITGLGPKGHFETWWHGRAAAGTAPTALVCRPDTMAVNTIHRLERMGVHVPEDVSIIGFDDDYGDEGLLLPLSSVRIPVEEMVTMGVRMLQDHLNGIKTDGADISMPLELKIRESSSALN